MNSQILESPSAGILDLHIFVDSGFCSETFEDCGITDVIHTFPETFPLERIDHTVTGTVEEHHGFITA